MTQVHSVGKIKGDNIYSVNCFHVDHELLQCNNLNFIQFWILNVIECKLKDADERTAKCESWNIGVDIW